MNSQVIPLISIYMPTSNRESLAIRAIESIRKQSYLNWELFVVDDCSHNRSKLEDYLAKLSDERITLIVNDTKQGACVSRNEGIIRAHGQYITGIDDDDEWLGNRLSLFVQHINKLEKYSLLYANDYLVDSSNPNQQKRIIYPKPKFRKKLMFKRNIIGNQIFSKTERLKKLLFDTQLSAAQDYDMFLRMVVNYGEPFKIEEVTQILYINHGENQITQSTRKFSGYFNFYRKHKALFDVSSRKYQLFALYEIRHKKMSLKTKVKLLSLRNIKKLLINL